MNADISQSIFNEEIYSIRTSVLVVVANSWDSLKDDEQQLLTKILSSVKLNLAGVRVVTHKKFSSNDIRIYAPQYVISFGAEYSGTDRSYEVVREEEYSILKVDGLNQLDDSKKKSLWNALKQMFGI
jgi:DNA polymerase III psi subunit